MAATAGMAAGPLLFSENAAPVRNRMRHPWRIYEQNLKFPFSDKKLISYRCQKVQERKHYHCCC